MILLKYFKIFTHKVDEIILDDLFENISEFNDDMKKSLEKYDALIHLSLGGFGLTNLQNFPKIKTLLTVIRNCLTLS